MKELPRFLEKKEYSIKMVKVKFIPGEHCFLENIQIQLREIKVLIFLTFIYTIPICYRVRRL